jgi:hypothetical protein
MTTIPASSLADTLITQAETCERLNPLYAAPESIRLALHESAAAMRNAASELRRLAVVERERDALRRMARQLIDVTGAKGFRWYVDGPAELGDVVARAGAIIGYTPWKHPAARSGGEAGAE